MAANYLRQHLRLILEVLLANSPAFETKVLYMSLFLYIGILTVKKVSYKRNFCREITSVGNLFPTEMINSLLTLVSALNHPLQSFISSRSSFKRTNQAIWLNVFEWRQCPHDEIPFPNMSCEASGIWDLTSFWDWLSICTQLGAYCSGSNLQFWPFSKLPSHSHQNAFLWILDPLSKKWVWILIILILWLLITYQICVECILCVRQYLQGSQCGVQTAQLMPCRLTIQWRRQILNRQCFLSFEKVSCTADEWT